MPLLNDVARCQGTLEDKTTGYANVWTCNMRETCARYVERHTGSERTPNFAYLCIDGDESYIPTEKGETK